MFVIFHCKQNDSILAFLQIRNCKPIFGIIKFTKTCTSAGQIQKTSFKWNLNVIKKN